MGDSLPAITVYDRQNSLLVDLAKLQALSDRALPLCADAAGSGLPVLSGLREIEVSLLSDESIARVHRDFMDDPEPTDVITFEHGEILVSVDTAQRYAREHTSAPPLRELLLYIVHGLLHLQGFDDRDPVEAEQMKEVQERIVETAWNRGGRFPNVNS